MLQMHGGVWDAIIIIAYAGDDDGAIIRIMPQIHDGIWNTGAPQNNHAAFLKVRVLVPSSGSCFTLMTECGRQSSQSCSTFKKVRALAPSSGLCFELMMGFGIQAPLITIMQHY
jgi:hypothetical protein